MSPAIHIIDLESRTLCGLQVPGDTYVPKVEGHRASCSKCLEEHTHSSILGQCRVTSGTLVVADLSDFFSEEEWVEIQVNCRGSADLPRAALEALAKKLGIEDLKWKVAAFQAGFKIPGGIHPVHRGSIPVWCEDDGVKLQTRTGTVK